RPPIGSETRAHSHSWKNRFLKKSRTGSTGTCTNRRDSRLRSPHTTGRGRTESRGSDSAQERIGKMREMVALLEHHDVSVRMIKTTRPGYVVYEDEFQIVAVPFADSDI